MALSTRDVSQYATGISFDGFPDTVVARTKQVVLDSLGCCLGGYTSPPSKVLRELYERPTDGPGATVIGSGGTAPVEYAALINSTMVRYLDYNDTYIHEGRACHPSDHIPALLAVAEAEGASGADLLEAIVLAYELEGAGLETGAIWDEGFDYVTWGIASSVAAAGALMDLSERQLANALGIAGASSNALGIARRGEVSMWKGVAHPYVSHNAIQACQMSRAGMTGPVELFDGTGGFFEAVANDTVELGVLGGRDTDEYRIRRTNLKPYPCGYYMQSTVTATLDLVTTHGIGPDDVDGIEVRTFEQAAEILATPEKWATDLTRETADHSIPYTVAVAVVDGEVTPSQYRPAALDDERVHRLMDDITVTEDDELTRFSRQQPDAVPSVVRMETDGGTFESRVDYPLGHARNPMSDERIGEKTSDMAVEYLSPGQIDRMTELVSDLDSLASVDELLRTLVA